MTFIGKKPWFKIMAFRIFEKSVKIFCSYVILLYYDKIVRSLMSLIKR